MKKLFSLFFILYATRLFAQQGREDPRFAGMDTYADSVLKQFHIAGFAVAVVENDQVIYAKGFGYRDVEKKLPVTPNTVFPIGSCSKAFTAALCGVLAGEGKMNFDEPVKTYISWLQFKDPYTTEHATIRDLMTHRTGVPRHDAVYDFFDKSLPRDSLIWRIRYLQPFTELRKKYAYNNLIYTALGVACEKITGQTYERNLEDKLLKPLDMTNTSMSVADLMASPDHSLGYYYDNKKQRITAGDYGNEPSLECPAGGINSSVNDMAHWLIAWLNRGKYQGKQVLPDWYVAEAMRPQMLIDNASYGLGWNVLAFHGGHFKIQHAGSLPLANSDVTFYPPALGNDPQHRIGIVVLSNEFNDYATSLIRDYLSDILLNGQRTDALAKPLTWSARFAVFKKRYAAENSPQNNNRQSNPALQPLSHPLKDYAGTYFDPGYGTIEIFLKDDHLQGRFNKTSLNLIHLDFDIFNASPGGTLKFNTDNDGRISEITMPLEESVPDIIFRRIK